MPNPSTGNNDIEYEDNVWSSDNILHRMTLNNILEDWVGYGIFIAYSYCTLEAYKAALLAF